MATFRTVGKDVACSPFKTHTVEPVKQASGFVMAAPRSNLIPLIVMAEYTTLGLMPGDTVFVPQEYCGTAWAKRKLYIPGIEDFILVPSEQVHLVLAKP